MNKNISDSTFFSVVIPLYNKEKYIKSTIESVLNQTFSNFEIVIVDDGSSDNSCEIVKSIKDPRIRIIQQKNAGVSAARNMGIREAKGQYIAFLDADDKWMPEKLKKQYELHSKNPEIAWSCCAYEVVGGYTKGYMTFRSGEIDDSIDALMDGLSIWTSTVVIKKDVFLNKRLFFNESLCRSEDLEVWFKLACLYPKIGYIDEFLAVYMIKIEGSLANTEMKETDFSLLSMRSRISKELDSIEESRKVKLTNYINKKIQMWIIVVWMDRRDFSNHAELFQSFINKKLLYLLSYTNFLPIIIKKVLFKIIFRLSTQN